MVPDGDATSQVQRALRESNIFIPRNAQIELENARNKFQAQDFPGWLTALNSANNMFSKPTPPVPLCFLEGDLEWAIFRDLSSNTCKKFAASFGVEYLDKNAFIKKMGSKAIDGHVVCEAEKTPYMRKQIAETIPLSDLSLNVKSILLRWLANAGFTRRQAEGLFVEK